MVTARRLSRAGIALLIGAGTAVWFACSDHSPNSLTGPSQGTQSGARRGVPDLRGAMVAQRRHTDALLEVPGVVGTAVGVLPDGRPTVQVLLERPGIAGLPAALDGIPVTLQVSGRLMAFSDPTTRQRPAPLGYSVGHPAITAGTIGARVQDTLGNVYVLSNNHVLANSNGATIGDPEYQPGPYDGGTASDQIATLSDFQTITFSGLANNTIDAAIALSSVDSLDNATPIDVAYGIPSSHIWGDADGDGVFDDRNALLGLNVQKYGRTTGLTHGVITGVNATVTICYELSGFSCTKSARFVDQMIITPAGFSDGGDSGSLIVTDDANLNPVALLFAGSATQTIANRIDLVLNRFGVTIDGFTPGPLTDIAVSSIGVPAAVVVDSTVSVSVTVRNVGNQDVASAFDVTLRDVTANATLGTQSIAGLAPGASTIVGFSWSPDSIGDHTLVASQSFADDNAANDERSATVAVEPPTTDVGVASVSAPSSVTQGQTVTVSVTVGNVGNQDVGGSFDVTLQDATDGVTIGSQTVTGLTVGADSTLSFSWNTTTASLASHTLVATHDLADDDATNDQGSTTVVVAPKTTDVALTSITGPRSVTQGDTAHIEATVQNVGELDVTTSFAVVLTDATEGVPIDTQMVAGLALGDSAIVDFPWNTAGATVTGHTLIAQQLLPDDNPTNNSRAIGIIVDPPASGFTDIGITSISTPGAVVQGAIATIGVTVQNVGDQDVTTSFDVVLTDATAGVTLGTQTVGGLTAGTGTTLTFTWNTAGAALGSHSLVATHTLSDDNSGNNQATATVLVNPQATDIALTSITGPPSVAQGDTAHIGVTVENVGGLDVTASFDVVLTDANTGMPIDTQAVGGLAVGASAALDFPWNTAGVAITGHTLIAQQMLPDDNSTNNAMAIGILVNPPTTLVTDVAVTGVSAPGSATQGQVVQIAVTVGNVGNQDVASSFVVTLEDTTDGANLGSQAVSGLAVGASTTLTFTWNTAGATVGSHSLVASHDLTDDNAANNEGAAAVVVNAQSLDLAVVSVSAPGSVTQGDTATIGVMVQNVGQQDVGASFDVVLTDATAGVTLDTQAVNGLTAGATANLTFGWNTAGAALGSHTLVATQNLADDNAANDQQSATVSVAPKTTDVAVANITGPASVTQGDTAHIGVTLQNVGEQDVTTSFEVLLTDATAGMPIDTQTVTSLAVGASTTLDFAWQTAGVTAGGHTLIAEQFLPDDNSTNDARAIGILVNEPVVLVTDVAVSGVSAPGAVTEGSTASIDVTVQNVGDLDVIPSFEVVLTDATAGTTLGTQTVAGLVAGAGTTLSFSWNTTGASLGSHALVATHTLTDDNAANDQGSATIVVNAQTTDVALTSLTAPASVTEGDTASIGVTVQNVGQQDVSASFDVVLTDATAGATIGTQTVGGLAVGASTSVAFSWNTSGVALGGHTLVATQSLVDDNASNDQLSTTVTVSPGTTDLALVSLTGPTAVTQGDTGHIGVTVQNVGERDVSTSFDVVLTDATAGVTLGTQTVGGLAVGSSAVLEFTWNTAGAAIGGHTLIAQQLLADDNATNNSRAIGVTVNLPSVHVGDLAAASSKHGHTWSATVAITVHDANHQPVNGVTVQGSWGGASTSQCTTGATGSNGTCTIEEASIPNSTRLVSFSVSGLTLSGYVYQPSANHDPDGSSNGTTIFVRRQ